MHKTPCILTYRRTSDIEYSSLDQTDPNNDKWGKVESIAKIKTHVGIF